MQDDLLGYLLGALDPEEMARVASALRRDEDLRRQLAQIEKSLEPLNQDATIQDHPPADLVGRTLDSLPPLPSPSSNAGDEVSEPLLGDEVFSANPSASVLAGQGLSPVTDHAGQTGWRWQDWFAASMSAAIVLALVLPAIWNGRFEARKIACQDQLRRLGTAMTQFVTRNEQHRLPEVKESGPEAFAGIYAVRLREAGLMDDATIRWCPSFDMPAQARPTAFVEQAATDIASLHALATASIDDLRQHHRFAGGHYAYNLGVRDGDEFRSPRYEQRSGFAVLSDAPLGLRSRTGETSRPVGHDGRGLNVLYEDGHVRFVSVKSFDKLMDDPWLNHRGAVEAGVTPDDATLAPSWQPPFKNSIQR